LVDDRVEQIAVRPHQTAVDHLLHFAYGATWGALFGALAGRSQGSPTLRSVVLGTGLWGFGSLVLFPALRIGRPAWESGARENGVNLAAHVAYAAITVFLTEELARQPYVDVVTRNPRAGRVG